MKWEVTGAWKADGAEASMTVEAPNQRAAESIAAQRGMMVEQAIPQPAQAMIATTPQSDDTYRTVGRIAGVGCLLTMPIAVLAGDPLMFIICTVAGVLWLAMMMAQR